MTSSLFEIAAARYICICVCVYVCVHVHIWLSADPEEFLNSLLQQTLKADPLIHLRCVGRNAFFHVE